uniref:Uncharacterized protein n=1 Tax=Peronospora matthiolae TaxID=2874970 RepID=A0AAV1TNY3_9STRA
MRVYYFALAFCAALAGVTITASEPAESAISLGSVHDAAKHQDGVHFERSLMAAEATNHEARSSMGEQPVTVVKSMTTTVKAWIGRFAQHASMERLVLVVKAWAERLTRYVKFKLLQYKFDALAKEIEGAVKENRKIWAHWLIDSLTAKEADGLAKLYMYRGQGDTPDAALANVLAGTYGDEAMVYALNIDFLVRYFRAGTGKERVQSAMIAHWKAGDYTLETMISCIHKAFWPFRDHDFFHPAVQKFLKAVFPASSHDDVNEALFKHFNKNVRRLASALKTAESSADHDHEAVRECARWLESWQKVNVNGAAMI